MIKQHLDFRIPDHFNSTVWRYLNLKKFKSLLKDKSLYFSRSDLLGDSYEGTTTKQNVEYRKKFYSEATEHFLNKGLPEMQRLWGKCSYVSCWHTNNCESDAMWKLYIEDSKDFRNGVAIKTSITSLKINILDTERTFLLGFVNYIGFDKDVIPEWNAFCPLFTKRNILKHEQEFRIITDNLGSINDVLKDETLAERGLLIPINLSFIEEIIISPYSSDNFAKEVKELVDQSGIDLKIRESSITKLNKQF
jgi:hypothetical protein